MIARELGVHGGTPANWGYSCRCDRRKEWQADEPEKQELEALRKEIKRLRMKREILKRAVVFWVKESSK